MEPKTVSRGIRFVNFIVDLIVFAIIASTLLFIIHSTTDLYNDENRVANRIFSLLIYFLYYLIFETLLKTTPGKLVTKSRIVEENGETPTNSSIALRSILRLIPFEPLSIFFSKNKSCWHDRFSKTKIIRIIH